MFFNGLADVSRRSLLNGAARAAGAMALVATTMTAAQAGKMSQKSASYQGSPKGGERCDNCRLWQAPAACRSVEGPIAAKGWCALYVKA